MQFGRDRPTGSPIQRNSTILDRAEAFALLQKIFPRSAPYCYRRPTGILRRSGGPGDNGLTVVKRCVPGLLPEPANHPRR
jgi:hypothetical protein